MASRPNLAPLIGPLLAAAAAYFAVRYAGELPPARAAAIAGRDPPSANRKPRVATRQWSEILTNVWTEIGRDHISVMAAGVAFYAFLSLFPAMSALISIYGLIADPVVIEQQIANLSNILPAAALNLVSTQLHVLIAAPQGKLGIGLVISLLLTLWSAMSGTGTVMQAVTVAYEQQDARGILSFYGQAALLTIGIGAFALFSLFLIAVAPTIIDRLPIPAAWSGEVGLVRWPLLGGLGFVALACVYRFAPGRPVSRWSWFSPGTIAAALLWLLGSAGFSLYVSRFASYDKTYGSLGAVVVLLMWFYVSAYIVLAGAELNAELEKAASRSHSPPEG
jgi:membrane protein